MPCRRGSPFSIDEIPPGTPDLQLGTALAFAKGVSPQSAELALASLESLLAASPVGVAFLDHDLRYVRINDALAALNGHPADDHIGHTVAEMIPNGATTIEPLLRRVMSDGEAVSIEVNRPSPVSGQARTYHATFFPVTTADGHITGVGGMVSDITDVRITQHQLQQTQERMQSILEHTPASIWVKDAEGRIVLANQRLADALGHKYGEILGRRSEDLLPPEIAAQHQAHDQFVLDQHRAIEAEETVPGPDGQRTFLSIKFPMPGEPPLVGGIATEITERKRSEENLRVALRSRDRVLAAVSHDLRNPLNTIQLSAATMLAQISGDQPWRRNLEMIHRSCLRMEHLIADLLDMASITAGALSVDTRPESADALMRDAFELHQPFADEKRVQLQCGRLADDVMIECDRQRVLQVFENLIGNALKFCRAGDTVALDATRDGDAVCFHVDDSGPGIAPAIRPHLFDPYSKGSDTGGGVGLGLYIARGIVERHGGRIDVEPKTGHGTRFSFTIPMVMRMILMACMLAFGSAALAQSTPPPQQPAVPNVDFTVEVLGTKVADFSAKMDAYAALRRSLEKDLPSLTVTSNASDIRRAEQALAERIRRARKGADRGDIFTEDTRHAFRQLLRPVTNAGICESIRDDNPGEFGYPINAEYPKDRPVSTVPPSILAVLPRLPGDVMYRFLDRDLILHDVRANIILDRIDNAIRCRD